MSMILNRRHAATVITLSMVKTNKKKGQPTSLKTSEGTAFTFESSGKCTGSQCKEILRSISAPLGGTVEQLRQRGILLADLHKVGLGSVPGLSIDDARGYCRQLELTMASKIEMVERIGRVLLNPIDRDTHDLIVAAIMSD
ncbi:hypothetical protein SARC_00126 [Sphaeroforma arctica JP610]|uniref:Uncharacterized protein n=1 Tax=Sphaeroforma arctica JP610 TaxID=667725 RepID=A0A0L0GFX3_9EUKA|nr:hypothetical protein SARC_00126 [Sphaeroforma arctica JP610]KNC87754.1 hypothetical protein SARC_00126 [Sphaeroforma arctica JP610]|eukprot:XP_014161656.1 hypothetical protein SARC_00126 [Sphaeroforma arctica JP610]